MVMDIKTIEYVANLARIEVEDSEKESVAKDLAGVLAYVDQIQAIAKEISNTKPNYLVKNIASEDVYKNEPSQYTDAILDQAPEKDDHFFVVKKVL